MLRFLCCSLTAEALNPEPRITTTNQVVLEEPQHDPPPLLFPPAVVPFCTPALKPDFPQPAVLQVLKRIITQANSVGAAEGSKTAAVLSYGAPQSQHNLV